MTHNAPRDVFTASKMDYLMEVLSKQQRRVILYRLKQNDRLQPFESSDSLHNADLELYHIHLPKLEAAVYIEWNRETREFKNGPQSDEVETLFTPIENILTNSW